MGTKNELIMLQALPLEVKIRKTQQRIREWVDEYGEDGCYVSRSGGKDSDVLGDIVRKMYPNIPHVFVNTGLEFDSVRKHAMEECDEVLRPEMSFVQIVTKYGYPVASKEVSQCVDEARKGLKNNNGTYQYRIDKLNGTYKDKNGNISPYNMKKWKFLLDAPFRISNQCCNVMKKKPAKKYGKVESRNPFIGTMTEESRLRQSTWMKNGCNAFNVKRPSSTPLSFWTEQDILQYININHLEIADAYGDIVQTNNKSNILTTTKANRTGCVFCMFGISQDTDRFLRLKEIEPKKYDYVMRGGKFDEEGMWIPHNGLGYKFVIDWLNEHGNLNIKY